MSSIAALDRRCFLAPSDARGRAVPDRCFLAGRVPLRPHALVQAPSPKTPAERESVRA